MSSIIRIDKDPTLQTLARQETYAARGLYAGLLDNWDGEVTMAAERKYKLLFVPLSADKAIQLTRWKAAVVRPARLGEVEVVVDRILVNRARYEKVSGWTGVPWFVIASLHNMESGGSFARHLHEGSSLNGRTKYLPKGRPLKGNPPFTWEESAVDALQYDRMDQVNWESLVESLYACERYNGTGYLDHHREVPSPYLWAGTSLEVDGKYVGDRKWDPKARSGQIGVAAIWKQMQADGLIGLPG